MSQCSICESNGFARATVISTGEEILICCECDAVYYLDDEGNAVFETENVHYIGEDGFYITSWDDLANVVNL